MPQYGVLQRGRIIGGSDMNGWVVEVVNRAAGSRWGPVMSAVLGLAPGDRVIMGQVGLSADDYVIIARVPGEYPGVGDIPGLQAALDSKLEAADLEPIEDQLEAHAGLLTAHAGQLVDHTDRITTLETWKTGAQGDIDDLQAAVAALQAAQITSWGPGLTQAGTNVRLDDYYALSLTAENDYARLPDGQVASSPLCTLGSGLTLNVPLGLAGYVRGRYYVRTTATTRVAAANADTNPRLDRLVLRLTRATGFVTPALLQGTPAASPALPALTQDSTTWDVPLCYATCPGSGSAQNYSNLTQEYRAVSPDVAQHVWTGTRSYAPGVNDQDVANWVTAINGGIASVTSSTQLYLNRGGIWTITMQMNSDAGVSGIASSSLYWPDGMWQDSGGRLYDTRGRSQGFAGAGQLNSMVSWTGYVPPVKAALPITVRGGWTPSTGSASVVFGFTVQAEYQGA